MKNLKTVSHFAKLRGVSRQTVYDWIGQGHDSTGKKVKSKEIDGVTFVVINK